MPETSILSDDFIRELINVGQVDIVVGVPTYNHAQTVGQVVQAIRAGLLQGFPRARVCHYQCRRRIRRRHPGLGTGGFDQRCPGGGRCPRPAYAAQH